MKRSWTEHPVWYAVMLVTAFVFTFLTAIVILDDENDAFSFVVAMIVGLLAVVVLTVVAVTALFWFGTYMDQRAERKWNKDELLK
jgi:DMSO/TMAO reductase YedYZ heme-binding membrane subunit